MASDSPGLLSTTLRSVRATLRDELASSGRTAEDAFHGIDTDQSGSIDESEFATFVHAAVDHANESRGEGKLVLTPELVTGMFRGLDSEGDGAIAMHEFTTWLSAGQPDDGCTQLAKRACLASDHATPEAKRAGTVGSLQLRRLVSIDAEANESVGASKRLAWMLLGDVHVWARMALSLDVQIKVGSGCVLRTWRFTHGALVLRSIVFDAPVAIIAWSACRTRVCWMWSTKMNCHTTC